VVDRSLNREQVFDREGRHLESWGEFYQPVGICGDDEGCAYISDMVPSLQKMAPKASG
jgi:peptidylglycine monooxygenase